MNGNPESNILGNRIPDNVETHKTIEKKELPNWLIEFGSVLESLGISAETTQAVYEKFILVQQHPEWCSGSRSIEIDTTKLTQEEKTVLGLPESISENNLKIPSLQIITQEIATQFIEKMEESAIESEEFKTTNINFGNHFFVPLIINAGNFKLIGLRISGVGGVVLSKLGEAKKQDEGICLIQVANCDTVYQRRENEDYIKILKSPYIQMRIALERLPEQMRSVALSFGPKDESSYILNYFGLYRPITSYKGNPPTEVYFQMPFEGQELINSVLEQNAQDSKLLASFQMEMERRDTLERELYNVHLSILKLEKQLKKLQSKGVPSWEQIRRIKPELKKKKGRRIPTGASRPMIYAEVMHHLLDEISNRTAHKSELQNHINELADYQTMDNFKEDTERKLEDVLLNSIFPVLQQQTKQTAKFFQGQIVRYYMARRGLTTHYY